MTPRHSRESALALLGLPKDATRRDIVSAYRRLARTTHPDVAAGPLDGPPDFAAVRDAYQQLTDLVPGPEPAHSPNQPASPVTAQLVRPRTGQRRRPPIVAGPVHIQPPYVEPPYVEPQGLSANPGSRLGLDA